MVLTIAAQTSKGQCTAVDFTAAALVRAVVWYGDMMHIHYRIAAGADKMHMGVDIAIESLHPADCGYARDFSVGLEFGQVSVDCSQRDVWMLFMEHLMEHLCRRVDVRAAQAFINGVALFELLCGVFHLYLLFGFLG